MKAYLIANLTVTSVSGFQKYANAVPAVIAQYGGRYIVRGGAVTNLEGDLGLNRVVILEFPSPEAARAFYFSAEYAPLLALRESATRSTVSLVEGCAG